MAVKKKYDRNVLGRGLDNIGTGKGRGYLISCETILRSRLFYPITTFGRRCHGITGCQPVMKERAATIAAALNVWVAIGYREKHVFVACYLKNLLWRMKM